MDVVEALTNVEIGTVERAVQSTDDVLECRDVVLQLGVDITFSIEETHIGVKTRCK